MIEYFVKYYDKLIFALIEHIQIVVISMFFSLLLGILLTLICVYCKGLTKFLLNVASIIYSIPSLALFALMIPLTGLGMTTAIIVLVAYNQYILLRNFLTGLNEVDSAVVDAAVGMGMTKMQTLVNIQVPLAKKSIFSAIRLAIVSTIGIATIAACINAGGLGTILFDGLRTMNINKIIWGSILSAGLAIFANWGLNLVEKRFEK